jgi:hypothetical protein
MEDFDDFLEDELYILEIIGFGFPRFQYTRSDRFHGLDTLTFYSRFNLIRVKASVLHFLILIEEEIEFSEDTT